MTIINELVRLVAGIAMLVLSRWLLELSTPEYDLAWLGWKMAELLRFMRWYGGYECIHQLRARRLLAYG